MILLNPNKLTRKYSDKESRQIMERERGIFQKQFYRI